MSCNIKKVIELTAKAWGVLEETIDNPKPPSDEMKKLNEEESLDKGNTI